MKSLVDWKHNKRMTGSPRSASLCILSGFHDNYQL